MTSTEASRRSGAFPRQVKVLGVASLLTDVASEMCVPLFPLLMAALGGGTALLGLMEGLADATSALVKLASGRLSDRMARRKPLVVSGYLLSALVRPLLALATGPMMMVLTRGADRVGKGIRSAPRDALLSAAVPPESRAAAFGFHRSMDHAGAVLGPVVAAAVLASGTGLEAIRLALAASVVPGLAAVAVLFFGVREPSAVSGGPPASRTPATSMSRPPASSAPPSQSARLLLVVTTLFSAARIQEVLFLAMLSAAGTPALMLPLAWSAMHLVKSITGTPLGRMADRMGRERALRAGYAVYALTLGLAALATSHPAVLLGVMLLYALHHGLTEGVEKALVSLHWPASRQGAGFGVYHALAAVVALPAGFAHGWLLEHHGQAVLCGVLAVAGAACALLALTLGPPAPAPA